jgi:hypothetical protein
VTSNRARWTLLAVALLVVITQRLVPYGGYTLYPFTLLATWVHEMGHGLTALALGGQFVKLEIFGDASGLATTASREGLRSALVSAAGLLAPPLLSALILMTVRGPRRAKVFLVTMAAALVISLLLWVRSWVGLPTVLGLALIFAAGVRFGSDWLRLALAQLVAVVLGLDTITRTLSYVFMARIEEGATAGGRSDVGGIADALGGPYWFWGGLVALLALALLALGLWSAVQPERAATPAVAPQPEAPNLPPASPGSGTV